MDGMVDRFDDDALSHREHSVSTTTRRLYVSHFLSVWNSRAFEFGAILFIISITPGTLFYSSVYALVRAFAATVLSSKIGSYIDHSNRLVVIRASIIWQRIPVATSCAIFGLLMITNSNNDHGLPRLLFGVCFSITVLLACVEKLASIANTVAIERDWAIVIATSLDIDRAQLNAAMRRIDLFCKLAAPVFISLIQAYSTLISVLVLLGLTTCSVLAEYIAIARVYSAVPELAVRAQQRDDSLGQTVELEEASEGATRSSQQQHQKGTSHRSNCLSAWKTYTHSPAFLPSFSLSLLYLTVLSTASQWQAYMLSNGFDAVSVSLFRFAAVISELLATCLAPPLMKHLGDVRAGLWSINFQVLSLTGAVFAFALLQSTPGRAGPALTAGIILSRLGLWAVDLAVQDIVQEATAEDKRGEFSTSEQALQNFFELLAFTSTVIFPQPKDFLIPVFISLGAVITGAACFAAYVRRERGHLIHISKCLKGSQDYQEIMQ
ncbi:hypothetical protein BT63DRAFT_452038 [Microthyrium microscopicum]|uniref:Solute carrier family 40 member n=1 Tax=Microthyrium microscopicum TaxID=703497 RepID=A0A6A6URF1_9PEZI|nr:hypothetical protein BT63DRAFT_452038 [Microthyrium microscopicum]